MGEVWEFKRLWTRSGGADFSIQVSCHEMPECPEMRQGPYRWCVYAYVRKSHPLMAKFEGDSISQDAANAIPFHGGCTYLEYIRDEAGKVVCVKVGADYNHLGDDHFTHLKEMPIEVDRDAQEMFDWLKANAEIERTEGVDSDE